MSIALARIALACLAASVVSCGPPANAPPESPPARVWELDCRTLHNSYRDHSERWTGQTVRVALAPGSFTPSGRELHWRGGLDTDPPDVVFECATGAPADPVAVDIVAVCLGRVEDGQTRVSGCRWHVRLRASVAGATSR